MSESDSTKLISLTQGKYAIVDAFDYDRLACFKWSVTKFGYAFRYAGGGRNNRRYEWMHRVINQTPQGLYTDHINGNRLDNRRANLRTVTHKLNAINTGLPRNNTTGFKGVYRRSDGKKWFAAIVVDQKSIHLGCFDDFEDAVSARKAAEGRYFKDAA